MDQIWNVVYINSMFNYFLFYVIKINVDCTFSSDILT